MEMTEQKHWTAQMIQDELGISRSRVNQLALRLGLGTLVGPMRIFSAQDVELMRSRPRRGSADGAEDQASD